MIFKWKTIIVAVDNTSTITGDMIRSSAGNRPTAKALVFSFFLVSLIISDMTFLTVHDFSGAVLDSTQSSRSSTTTSSTSRERQEDDDNLPTRRRRRGRRRQQHPYYRHRRLEFVHIPKTGGTVIESTAAQYGIVWTICHFAQPHIPPLISNNETHCPLNSLKYGWPTIDKYNQCPWWHVPAVYFECCQPVNPYAGAVDVVDDRSKQDDDDDDDDTVGAVDLFVVVRNPYERIISEYYYFHTHVLSKEDEDDQNDVKTLNTFVTNHLRPFITQSAALTWQYVSYTNGTRQKTEQQTATTVSENHLNKLSGAGRWMKLGNDPYFQAAGHYIPQYDFVYVQEEIVNGIKDGHINARNETVFVVDDGVDGQKRHTRSISFQYRHRRYVRYVLRFENIRSEFHELMKMYERTQNVTLPTRHVRPSREKKLGVQNLTKQNIEWIERIYDEDFTSFGYQKISSKIPQHVYDRNDELCQ